MTYIALLRAINVGGHTVSMERLRGLFTELGYKNVRTLIASGNVVFDAGSKKPTALEAAIEKHLGKSLGYGVSTFVRTHEEIAAVVDHEPYPRSVIDKAHALWIGFLKEAPGADAARKLAALRCATDDFCVHGREVFRRDPQFLMDGSAHRLRFVAGEECGLHGESGDISAAAGRNIPVAGNLSGVFFIEHRIEDRLLRKAGRKGGEPGLPDQRQLLRADGPVESGGFGGVRVHAGIFV